MAFDDHLLELAGPGIELRSAGADDGDLINRVVWLASQWRDETSERGDTMPTALPPDLTKYYENWGRPDDVGVLAFRGIEFAGGAYVRRFGAADGSYGYVADDIPELGIAIEPNYRRRGLGVLLLAALKAKVIGRGFAGISLSVEPDNGARELYSRMGFTTVDERDGDVLMVWSRPG